MVRLPCSNSKEENIYLTLLRTRKNEPERTSIYFIQSYPITMPNEEDWISCILKNLRRKPDPSFHLSIHTSIHTSDPPIHPFIEYRALCGMNKGVQSALFQPLNAAVVLIVIGKGLQCKTARDT
ncbi:unnamed protein product [Thelazia callipaeda]|uniref:PH domain-containing protein n=1 Tax=Thelazia callipaeda TaxID=103827 RepID=A0A0N5D1Q3_THECL|nr:unnamed protein product [Thelazia callipaeda]